MIIMLASGVALGSWASALVLIVLSVPFLLYRAVTEDRALKAELPGYRDYAGRVRWRLFPCIW
jgi:protein-S-isoprenylcysteine O-methyltransferase Ste14